MKCPLLWPFFFSLNKFFWHFFFTMYLVLTNIVRYNINCYHYCRYLCCINPMCASLARYAHQGIFAPIRGKNDWFAVLYKKHVWYDTHIVQLWKLPSLGIIISGIEEPIEIITGINAVTLVLQSRWHTQCPLLHSSHKNTRKVSHIELSLF